MNSVFGDVRSARSFAGLEPLLMVFVVACRTGLTVKILTSMVNYRFEISVLSVELANYYWRVDGRRQR